MTYQNYEFTAFDISDLRPAGESQLDCGETFTMPSTASLCFNVSDNDSTLSGDKSWSNDNASDRYGQTATIEGPDGSVGNGGQIYAENYLWVNDENGTWFLMIEIEQEGSHENYYTFHEAYGLPADGATLTVHSVCDVTSNWVSLNCLDAGEKSDPEPVLVEIAGRYFCDEDRNHIESHGDTGVEGKIVELFTTSGEFVARTTTDANGEYSFDAAEGDYYVRFEVVENSHFNTANVGHDGTVDSDVVSLDGNWGISECFSVSEGCPQLNIDAGIKKEVLIEIAGRYFCDEDRNNLESDGDTGVEGKVVELFTAHGEFVARTTTDANGEYSFEAPAGDYYVNFEVVADTEFSAANVGHDGTVDSDVICEDGTWGKSETFHVSEGCPQLHIDAGITKNVGSISGTVFCDTDCDGLNGGFVTEPGCDYTYEAEHMGKWGYQTAHSSTASGGAIAKLNCAGHDGDLYTTHSGKSGVYNVSLFIQDENDGQSEVYLKVGGELVTIIKLDTDTDGGGSDHGNFSEFVIEDVEINHGDEIKLWVGGDHGEWVRVDKIELEGQDRQVPATETTTTVIADEDFTGGANGWSCDWVASSDSGDQYLTGAEHTYTEKTFDVPAGTGEVCLTFDFLEVDSWDSETFKIFINGHRVDLGHFSAHVDEGATSFDAGNGITVTKAASVDIDGYGFDSSHSAWNNDNKHAFTITIDNPTEHLKIGFGSHLSAGIHNESWGVDNFKLEAKTTTVVQEPVKEGVTIKLLDGTTHEVLDTTTTDADGNYAFNNVPVGDYKIMGVAPDGTEFTIKDVNGNANDDIDSDVGADGTSDMFTVTTGSITDIDLGVCEKPLGTLSGRYFDDADRDGLDNDGADNGIEGVVVTLLDAAGDPVLEGGVAVTTTTDANGNYSFEVEPGTYGVEFAAPAAGTVLTTQDVDGNVSDDIDSDADEATNQILGLTVVAGEDNGDNDAGTVLETGSIAGTYFCDENNNGIQDGGDKAVALATVLLLKDGVEVDSTTTDADGTYQFDDVVPGAGYTVVFVDENGDPATGKTFVDGNVGLDDTIDSDVEGTDPVTGNGSTAEITVNPGEAVENVDGGIEDPGTASIGDRVFFDADGNGVFNPVDGGDEGVALVTVELLQDGVVIDSTETDVLGFYEFTGLKAGEYQVQFTAPDGTIFTSPSMVAAEDVNDDSDANAAGLTDTITLDIGEEENDVDAGLIAEPGSISGRYFEDDNRDGLDNDGADNGIGGAVVTLLDAAGEPVLEGGVPVTTTTNPDGTYTFEDVAPGTYGVQFSDPATGTVFTTQDVDGDVSDDIDSDANPADGKVLGITVVAGEDNGDNDAGTVLETGSIAGTYFCDENNNGIQDGGDKAVALATVLLLKDGVEVDSTTTDADGTYQFDDVVPGAGYTVVFVDENGDPATGKTFVDGNVGLDDTIDSDVEGTDPVTGNGSTAEITVNPGEAVENVDGGIEDPGTASIGDRVFFDADGNGVFNPVDGGDEGVALVTVELLQDGVVIDSTETDVLGFYEFTGLKAGEYQVQFTAPDGTIFTSPSMVAAEDVNDDSDANAAGLTDTITLDIGEEENDVDAGLIAEPGSISGRYFEDDNRDGLDNDGADNGIGGAVVTLLDAAGEPVLEGGVPVTTTTNPDGTYTFEDVAPGTYGVQFSDPATGTVFTTQDVDGDVSDDIDSDANPADGKVLGITVVAGEDNGDNDAGTVLETGSIAGTYFCDENNNGIQDGGDKAVALATVLLLKDGVEVDSTTTDADGTYQFDDVVPGAGYTVVFVDENGDPATGKTFVDGNVGLDDTIDSDVEGTDPVTGNGSTAEITVNPGEAVENVDGGIEDPGTASIGDRVFFDADGNGVFNPVDGGDEGVALVTVELLQDGVVIDSTETDVLGFYEFTGLKAGEYQVQFTAPDGTIFTSPSMVAAEDVNDDSDANAAGLTDTITLDIGEEENDVDAGLIAEPGSISGRYFEDDNRDGLDNDGADNGIGGAVVTLLDAAGEPVLEGGVPVTTTTNPDGTYTFEDVAPGTYGVQFSDPATGTVFTTQDVDGDVSDDIDSDANPADGKVLGITVVAGEDNGDNDAGTVLETGSIAGTYFCDENNNGIQDGGDKAVALATVLLLKDGVEVDSTTTDADGTYQFDDVVPGAGYTVVFVDENGDPATGKTFVDGNVGLDDTIDSDVEGTDPVTGNGSTAEITVNPGEAVENVDGGIEDPGTASIGDRVFFDADGNGVFNPVDGGDEGVALVTVELLQDGVVIDSTETDVLGFYEFTGLKAGEYQVQFTAPDGTIFTSPSMVAAEDVNDDSDANAAGLTDTITLDIGEEENDVDAGLVAANPNDPDPQDDTAKSCADETFVVNLLDNDGTPDGLGNVVDADGDIITVTSINIGGADFGVGEVMTLAGGATATLNGDGTVTVDGTDAYSELLINTMAMDTFEYTVSDGNGGSGTADVDLTFCGAFNTAATIAQTLPSTVTVTLTDSGDADAFTAVINGSGNPDLDGRVIEAAYCIEFSDSFQALFPVTFDVSAGMDTEQSQADFTNVNVGTDLTVGGITIQTGIDENIDLINYIINQDFTSMDNGDGTGTNYTDAEVQRAIWGITDNSAAFDTVDPAVGTDENVLEILEMAFINGEGFEAGEGDLFTLVLNPQEVQFANGTVVPEAFDNDQAFIIALPFDTFKEECIC